MKCFSIRHRPPTRTLSMLLTWSHRHLMDRPIDGNLKPGKETLTWIRDVILIFILLFRPSRWRRAIHASSGPSGPSVVDRLMDNSNRRQYGMGVVGRMTRRSLRQSMTDSNKHLKRQLDSFEDHRPYFTYWTCTVQVLIMFIALITYGLGPIGFNLHRRSGSVSFYVFLFKQF